MELVSDTFDFAKYLAKQTENYRLDSPTKSTTSVVDMFYGAGKDIGAVLPWAKTHKLIKFRPGEVTVWCGINGHGKSMLTSQVALELAWQGEKPCIASMEMLPRRTLWRMVRQASGSSSPSIAFIKQFLRWLDQRLCVFDHHGTVNQNLILGAARYAIMSLGVKHMFIDSLAQCVAGEDDYNGQKTFTGELCATARDLNVHIHLVHHVRKTESEYSIPGKFDGKGSGAIADQVDNWITCWRNKRKEATLAADPVNAKAMAEPDCILNVDKSRNGEWEGRIALWYQPESMTYVEAPGARSRTYQYEPESVVERDEPAGQDRPVPPPAARAAAAGAVH